MQKKCLLTCLYFFLVPSLFIYVTRKRFLLKLYLKVVEREEKSLRNTDGNDVASEGVA